jgi:hypothetical protein
VLTHEQENLEVDVRRRADKLQASARLLEDKRRDISRKEAEVEKMRYEWELREVEQSQREAILKRREGELHHTEKELFQCVEASRGLELHAVQVRRIAERVRERERALWETASQVVPNGARALSVIKDELRGTKSVLDEMFRRIPDITKSSSV